MGFCVIDLKDDKKFVFVNFWNWRPTIEIIRSFKIIDDERLELMGMSCVGAEVSMQEARTIGERLRELVQKLRADDRVRLDLSVTSEPDDGTMYYGKDVHKNYSAAFPWLTQFCSFCSECKGFRVS